MWTLVIKYLAKETRLDEVLAHLINRAAKDTSQRQERKRRMKRNMTNIKD